MQSTKVEKYMLQKKKIFLKESHLYSYLVFEQYQPFSSRAFPLQLSHPVGGLVPQGVNKVAPYSEDLNVFSIFKPFPFLQGDPETDLLTPHLYDDSIPPSMKWKITAAVIQKVKLAKRTNRTRSRQTF